MAGIPSRTQTNLRLNIHEKREFTADTLAPDHQVLRLLLVQQFGPIVEFDLTVKRYDKQRVIDFHGNTIQIRVRPDSLNRRTDFPLNRSSSYLTDFLSSIHLIPRHLASGAALEISDYVFPSSNPGAAVIHFKADLIVSIDTILSPLEAAQRDRARIDDSIVLDAFEGELEPHRLPHQPPRKLRCVRDLKERYGFCAPSDDQLGNCAVCLDKLEVVAQSNSWSRDNHDLLKMPCSHVFHCGCISKWLHRKDSCPLCRSVIP